MIVGRFTIIFDPPYDQFLLTWQDDGKPVPVGFSLAKKDFEEMCSYAESAEKLDRYYPYNISGQKFDDVHTITEGGKDVSFIFNSKLGKITKKVSFSEISDAIV